MAITLALLLLLPFEARTLLLPFAAGAAFELPVLAAMTLALAVFTVLAITLLLTVVAEVQELELAAPVALPLRVAACVRGIVCVLAAVDLAMTS